MKNIILLITIFVMLATCSMADVFEVSNTETAQTVANKIAMRANNDFHNLKLAVKKNFNQFWYSKFTPEEICQADMAQCYKFFIVSYMTEQFIKSIDPSYELLVTPKIVSIDENHNVTFTERENVQ